jgi:co-chaperonin GroES (HSP10)
MKPLSNRVLIKQSDAKTIVGGFILPDSVIEKPLQGVVVAKGEECKWVAVGDTILYKPYTGAEVESPEGEKLVILIENTDIFAIL